MKIFNKIRALFLIALSVCINQQIFGLFTGNTINLSSGSDQLIDDEMIAKQQLNLKCGERFYGQGYLKAPDISITAKKFAFTGTIECGSKCTITVAEPFDQKMFKRAGNGEFIIKIDPQCMQRKEDVMSPGEELIKNIKRPTTTSDKELYRMPSETEQPKREESNAALPKKSINIQGFIFHLKGEFPIALADAIEKNDSTRVESLFNQEADAKNDKKVLALFMVMAGLYNRLSIAEQLIKSGADVNAKHFDGIEPLLIALAVDNADFAALLIRSGANPNINYPKTSTPILLYEVEKNNVTFVKVLLEAKNNNINATDSDGRTALMIAKSCGYSDIADMLLKVGAKDIQNAPIASTTIQNNKHFNQRDIDYACILSLAVGFCLGARYWPDILRFIKTCRS